MERPNRSDFDPRHEYKWHALNLQYIESKLKDLELCSEGGEGRVVNPNSTYIKCFDWFGEELRAGDVVDVQKAGEHRIYMKPDGQLWFKPYGKEERVSHYFSNDMDKVRSL
jgi:hypothetical protein